MYDIAIIGGGPAGYPAGIKAAKLGLRVAIIEKENVGGICLNWGCIPTKALLNAAEKYQFVKEKAQSIGINCADLSFDFEKIIQHSREIVEKLTGGINYLVNKNKIELFRDTAYITQDKKIKLQNSRKILEAKNIIIATGTGPRALKGLEFDHKIIWNYQDAMTPEKLPESLLIIGSGAIGIEFANFYNAFGTKVIVIEMQSNILPTEDSEISDLARKIFNDNGIEIHTETTCTSIKKLKNSAQVTLNIKGKEKDIKVEKILVAAGVIANLQNLGIENFKNIELENEFIMVNEFMQTGEKNIYAIGDVAGGPCLAHKAIHEAILCIENIQNKKALIPIKRENIPSCIYCHPQIASVGLTEKQAKEQGLKIKIGRAKLNSNGKSVALSETEGIVKTIFDKETGELLGAHMIGHEVTEMIQGYVIAKNLEGTEEDLKRVIFPHPTISETMHESILNADDEDIHS